MESLLSTAAQADAATFTNERAREHGSVELEDGPVLFDLIRAYRAAHALNGVLLDLSAADFDLTVGDTQIGKIGEEIWTASLRSDIDGPGGVYVLIAPASMVWKMPNRASSRRAMSIDTDSVTRQISNALDMVAEVGISVAVRIARNQIVLLTTSEVVLRNRSVILTRGKMRKVPVALKLS